MSSTCQVTAAVSSGRLWRSWGGVIHINDVMTSSGEHAGVWFLDLKSGSGSTGQGQPPVKADVIMSMDSSDFCKMFAGLPSTPWPSNKQNMTMEWIIYQLFKFISGKLKPTMAFMSGKLRIKGDMSVAIKLEKLMSRMNKAKLWEPEAPGVILTGVSATSCLHNCNVL